MNKRLLVLLRGPSGSGKSTLAKKIVNQFGKDNCVVFSTDEFFMQDHEYRFDPKKLGQAHAWNQNRADEAMASDMPVVVIDNTNLSKWEYQKYLDMAQKHGYEVKMLVAQGQFQNTHGVPQEKVEQMKKKFEKDDRFPTFEFEEEKPTLEKFFNKS